ncbi:hypothetical protein C5167_043686 [Papaver somniferum]|uniref:Uncharacterized protein n=1 Tax=Papaver somniferum TaxID=3469 RepID=A0A4Y7L9E5_PAPSO|nr:hypothetical protein C5167_043686 [Papaver somniferum]
MTPFSTAEDVALIRAYCSVASEPLIGRNMDAAGFWARILAKFRAAMNDETARSTKSIQTRTSNLKRRVKRYVGHVRARCRAMGVGGYDVATVVTMGPRVVFDGLRQDWNLRRIRTRGVLFGLGRTSVVAVDMSSERRSRAVGAVDDEDCRNLIVVNA